MSAVKQLETKWEAPAHPNIYAALAASQLEFGSVTKGAVNPAFKSKYANLSDVAGVVIPTLARHGVAVLHYLAGESYSVMVTAFVHAASDTRVECPVPLIVAKNDMQGMKSATTYAKRIGLESLSGVAPEDDDGNGAAAAPPKTIAKEKTISKEQAQAIRDGLTKTGTEEAKFLAWALPGVQGARIEDIQQRGFAACVEMLRKKYREMRARDEAGEPEPEVTF